MAWSNYLSVEYSSLGLHFVLGVSCPCVEVFFTANRSLLITSLTCRSSLKPGPGLKRKGENKKSEIKIVWERDRSDREREKLERFMSKMLTAIESLRGGKCKESLNREERPCREGERGEITGNPTHNYWCHSYYTHMKWDPSVSWGGGCVLGGGDEEGWGSGSGEEEDKLCTANHTGPHRTHVDHTHMITHTMAKTKQVAGS